MDHRIFINIASYRDQELWQTLDSVITQAEDASKLHIAIYWQDDNDLNRLIEAGWAPASVSAIAGFPVYQLQGSAALVELIALPYQKAQGVGFARALCDQLYQDEQWFLQIDAHSLFDKMWDRRLIDTLATLSQQCTKPLISNYPPSYHTTPEGDIVFAKHAHRVTFNTFNPEGLPTLASRVLTSTYPVQGSFLAAGFIFTQGAFVTEVGNDSTIFFEGEEITLSLRAFSWGYDIYHLGYPVLWHHYTRQDAPKIWNDQSLSAQQAGEVDRTWISRELRSQQHVKRLLGLPTLSQFKAGDKTLGPLRTRQQFEHQCGLNFQLASCYADCLSPECRSHFPPPPNDAAWRNAHRIYHTKPINVTSLIGSTLPDKLFIHLYGLNTPRLAQYQYSTAQVMARSGRLDITCWSTPNRPPSLIRLASWWEGSGWGIIIEWPWSKEDGPYCLL
ncbi:GlcNAc-transferase family protein [Rosenbergiella nectarea]|nr:GlcNAc-transferase family protein [Rosenbergiella nectarea]